MTNEEAMAIIRKEYLCVDRDCDIERSCGKCDLVMPSKEPILEAYNMAIKALEQDCDTCEVGNPCLYCKHEFEPQENCDTCKHKDEEWDSEPCEDVPDINDGNISETQESENTCDGCYSEHMSRVIKNLYDSLESEEISREDIAALLARGSEEMTREDAIEALEQEPSIDMEEIKEIMECDADAETKCKMISSIVNGKPHYFTEQEPKMGRWIVLSSTDMYCSECNEIEHLDTSRKFCAYCGRRMVEPQEGEG